MRRRSFRPSDDAEPGKLKGLLVSMLQRRWGMAALRSNARLLLERLAYVGRGATMAAVRRDSAHSRFTRWTTMLAGRGPRLWRDRL